MKTSTRPGDCGPRLERLPEQLHANNIGHGTDVRSGNPAQSVQRARANAKRSQHCVVAAAAAAAAEQKQSTGIAIRGRRCHCPPRLHRGLHHHLSLAVRCSQLFHAVSPALYAVPSRPTLALPVVMRRNPTARPQLAVSKSPSVGFVLSPRSETHNSPLSLFLSPLSRITDINTVCPGQSRVSACLRTKPARSSVCTGIMLFP